MDVFSLGEIVRPNRPRVKPESMPDAPFIGMEHVEAHTMKLLGTVPAATMKSSAVHFKPGDVLYGRLRPYLNKVFRPTFEGLCSAEFIVFPETDRIDGRYLQYFLNSGAFVRFATHLNAGDRPRVDFDQIAPYKIPVPSLERQREIVAELEKQFSRLDEAVANLHRVKANLKRYKASVLKDAVEGRLVPTEAELARHEGRSFETGEQLLRRVLIDRRKNWIGRGKYKDPYVISGEERHSLPMGWTWISMDALAFVTKLAGFEYTKFVQYDDSGDLAVIKAENAGSEGFRRTAFSKVKSESVSLLTRSKLVAGDLLMVFVGAGTGKVACVPDDQPYFLGPNISMIRVDQNHACPQYIEHYLRSPQGHSLALGFAKAVAQPSLSMGTIRCIPIALPPRAEQVRIAAEVDRRMSLVRSVEAEVDTNLKRAQALRQSVLQQSFKEPAIYEVSHD